ncbi:hypothetical protein SLE2022_145060 [Rubroshorea leprosula]
MKKQGPCRHCGVESTPLWRNGPPDKPVLCNACGSRYRLRKSLDNYTPRNAQAIRRKRTIPIIPRPKVIIEEENLSSNNTCYSFGSDGSTSIIKSSAESFSNETFCLTRQIEPSTNFWDSQIPSRKRREVVNNNGLSFDIETLQNDLYNLQKGEDQTHEDVLIYEKNMLLIPPTEIGLGSILLKQTQVSSKDKK